MLDYKSTDIDWFCFINGCPIHVASNGGALPRNLYTSNGFIKAFNAVQKLEAECKWTINHKFVESKRSAYDYIQSFDENEQKKILLTDFINPDDYKNLSPTDIAYSWSFIEMAKRGFFSFDRVEGNRYRLVAFPEDYFSDLKNLKQISFPIDPIVLLNYHYWFDEKMLKVMSMTRHLFCRQKFSFGLDEDVDLIDIINSIISP